jgi:hypothetical protein
LEDFTLILGYFYGFSGFYLAWIFVYTWFFPGVEEETMICKTGNIVVSVDFYKL